MGQIDWTEGSAWLSADNRYRYELTRGSLTGKVLNWVMLNPSTADASKNDSTIRKCIGFAIRWGCTGIRVVNLFGVRATDPVQLKLLADPVGPENHTAVQRMAQLASDNRELIVCAWGIHGTYMDQAQTVMGWLDFLPRKRLVCLGKTQEGHPKHPLVAPYDTQKELMEVKPWK